MGKGRGFGSHQGSWWWLGRIAEKHSPYRWKNFLLLESLCLKGSILHLFSVNSVLGKRGLSWPIALSRIRRRRCGFCGRGGRRGRGWSGSFSLSLRTRAKSAEDFEPINLVSHHFPDFLSARPAGSNQDLIPLTPLLSSLQLYYNIPLRSRSQKKSFSPPRTFRESVRRRKCNCSTILM